MAASGGHADHGAGGRTRPLNREGEVLILTGPPGSGKSTAARGLASLAGSTKVHIHADDFWHAIKYGGVEPYLPAAHEQNGVVMRALASAVDVYAGAGYFVIVDGIIGPWFLHAFRPLTVPLHYVVLRPELEVAVQRCQQRDGDKGEPVAVLASIHAQFADLGELERHAVVTGEQSREQVVAHVREAVESGAFRLT